MGAAARFGLFDEVCRQLRHASSLGPLAILLDDLQDSGDVVFELFEFLARELGDNHAVLIAAAHRPLEAIPSQTRADLIHRLDALPSVRSIQLPGLSAKAARKLISHYERQPLEASLLDALIARADGNPFYLVQVARDLGSEASVRSTVRDPVERVAQSVQRSITARISALSPDARRWLRTAAALGLHFDRGRIARLLPNVDCADACEEAIVQGLVVANVWRENDLAFAHALVRDAVYEEISPSERRAIHLRIGDAIEDDEFAEAAFHLAEAAPLGAAPRAIAMLRRTAEMAERQFEPKAAGLLYRRAIDLLNDGDREQSEMQCDLFIAYGQTIVQDGQLDEAREALDAATALARRNGWGERLARATLAISYAADYDAVVNQELLRRLQEAIDGIDPGEDALHARLLSRLAIEVRYQAGGGARAAGRMLDEALIRARRAGDEATLAQVLEDTTLARWSAEDPDQWIELSLELVLAARKAENVDLLFRGTVGLVTEYMEIGDRRNMERESDRCAMIAQRYPSPYQRASRTLIENARHFLDGDFEAAESGIAAVFGSGAPDTTRPALTQLFYLYLETGRIGQLEERTHALLAAEPHRDPWKLAMARLLLEEGRLDEARSFLESATSADKLPRDRQWLPLVALMAEVVAGLNDRERAKELLAVLRPFASLNVVYERGMLYYGSVSHFLGILSHAVGEPNDAEVQLESALAAHQRMGSRPWLRRTRTELAAIRSAG